MSIKIVKVPFLIPNWAAAQVLFPNTIFAKKEYADNVNTIAHEIVHVDQIKEYGLFLFWIRYLYLLAKHGYTNHPMEIEARGLQNNPVIQERARKLIENAV